MVPNYIERIKVGHIAPGGNDLVQESPTTTVIDGHWGFGYVVRKRPCADHREGEEIERRGGNGVRQSHIGRLAAYPLMAMEEGMIGLITADSGRSPKIVAPFGGA